MVKVTERPIAIQGSYADLKFVKTRSVAVVSIEIPIEQADAFVAAFGTPKPGTETPVAIARMRPAESSPTTALEVPDRTRRDWRSLSAPQQAGIRCGEQSFRTFLNEVYQYSAETSDDAAEAVREICDVASRNQLEISASAHARWQKLDAEFQSWLHAPIVD